MLKRLIYLLLLIPLSCIDPYQVEVPEGEQLLIVEGTITSGPGPHAITLTRSATYGSDYEGFIRPVQRAIVSLRDDQGGTVLLTESQTAKGSYFTDAAFRAEVGRTYTLLIQTSDGKLYSSAPEKVAAVPELKNLGFRTVVIEQDGGENPKSGIQLIAEVDDPIEENNFYYWRTGPAVYILETRPDLYTPPISPTNPNPIPQPKPCCVYCFRTEISDNRSIFVETDDSFNGLTTYLPAAFVADDGMRFVNKFRIDVRQLGISQDAYRFLRLVQQQTETSGSIFDPPPATIRGNMFSLDDPKEVVLGYFIAAGESTQRIYVNKSELTFQQNRAIIPDDCREVEGANFDPPADWKP
ncbi:DUF4249 domain-containing protein [Algoriphagus sp. H41]|uniref:DUF4249 domain-containing protein n=1 Tax=Algoriphagus oliviformis TaxID=2811231 RepID=A0ABS3C0L4_9BACT|nr:DUF4249 domain-containing protein [Algoriphagus oliviformis]MBN7810161.1 DUF4249 domain-containing protein [Algoriphagus oliviformis]